jgi:hypothetical protein
MEMEKLFWYEPLPRTHAAEHALAGHRPRLYAGGDRVARRLIDNGVDAWLQHNGDQAIYVSLGVSYTALSIATFGAAAEAGVFVGASARVASFGAHSWRTLTGVAGVIGEGARRYGNQLTQWGARMLRSTTASIQRWTTDASAARGGGRLNDLANAGKVADRGGLSRVGRALEKHGGRQGSMFPKATGNVAEKNMQGQQILEDILRNPDTRPSPNKFGGQDYFDPTGRGARFNQDGSFRGFLEPKP